MSLLDDIFEAGGERPLLIDGQGDRTLSYAEVRERSRSLAAGLLAGGLEPGDRVIVSLPNSVETALLYLAALQAGVVVVPLGGGFGRRELRAILGRAQPKGIVTAKGAPGAAAMMAAELNVPALEPRQADGELPPPDDDAVVAVHFTSGTTGEPRGVAHRLRDFVQNGRRYGQASGVEPGHRFLGVLPMTFLGGYYNLLLLPAVNGASVVIDRGFDARTLLSFWDTPVRHDANALWFTPSMLAMLLRMDRGSAGRAHTREHVSFAAVGMAPLDPELRMEFERAYEVTLLENYGLAETLFLAAARPGRDPQTRSIGPPLPEVDLRIDDDGAIHARTPDLMAGYLGDEAPDGDWFDTGDVGAFDEDGALRITGREKELIIRGGINVSPREIEQTLAGVDGVQDLAVVGVPHPVLGEDIAVIVVCRHGTPLDDVERELRARARERLDGAQQPGLYVQIDELPRTLTGKVRSQRLRDVLVDRFGLAPRVRVPD